MMMADEIFAKAVVNVEVEVSLTDTWGSDCKLNQVYRQAANSAIKMLFDRIDVKPGCLRVIGTPKVTSILARRK
jgi:hypothetical protein